MKTAVEKMYGGNVWRQLNISNVLLVKEMKMNDKRIEELQVKLTVCIVNYPIFLMTQSFNISSALFFSFHFFVF